MLWADVQHDFAQSIAAPLDPDGVAVAGRALADLRRRALARLRDEERIAEDAIEIEEAADLRYVGQSFELTVPWRPDDGPEAIQSRFVEAHRDRYGYEQPDADVEIVTVRVAGRASLRGHLPAVAHPEIASAPQEATGTRPLFHDGAWHETPVYRRETFAPAIDSSGRR